MAIECLSKMAGVYDYLRLSDSAINVKEAAARQFKQINRYDRAVQSVVTIVPLLLEKGQTELAKKYLDDYDSYSGLFDEKMKIQAGYEVYYYIKGNYFIAVNKIDSAEMLFRKELEYGKDLNNQIAACRGLLDVFSKRGLTDSIAKYAKQSYSLNDSAYSLSEMENIQKLQASYNYNHAKLLAEQKAHEATRLFYMIIFLVASFIITILIGSIFVLNYRKKTILQIQQYKNDLSNLEKAQTELIVLRSEHEMSSILIKNKNEEIAALQQKVENYQNKIKLQSHDTLETRLQNSPIVKHLRQLLRQNPPKPAGRDDMRQLKILINEQIPSFYSVLNSESNTLSMIEYEICILIRVGFAPTDLCKLTGISDGYASNIRRRLLKKVYGLEGSPKEFDCKIKEIPADIS
jgi:tetratricopeptide (TPR) repeat protein